MSKKLLYILENEKLITEEQKSSLIKKVGERNSCTDEVVMNCNLVDEKILKKILLERFDVRFMDMSSLELDKKALKKISKELAYKYSIIPFKIYKNNLYIATSDPLNKNIIDELKFILNMNINVFYAKKEEILRVLDNIYEGEVVANAVEEFKEKYEEDINLNSRESTLEDAPAIKITNLIINKAIKQKASDIHFEPFEESVKVRMRIDGDLYEHIKIPKQVYNAVCTSIKVESGMDISKKFVPQDGKMNWIDNNKKYNLRVSSIPTIYGEKLVARILYNNKDLIHLDKLGFEDDNIIRNLLLKNRGIILITGPTGSGKSTTLYALIEEMDKIKKNIITIEDPVEYRISGVNQINVNNKAGLTFARGLRSVLRQDPDVIMIGEIRDEETAEIAVRAAITGHTVLSTLHTYDSISSILRLIDMKVPNYLAADAISAVIAQRLVRKICDNCKVSYEPNEWERKKLGLREGEKIFKGIGCEKCSNTGYKGRTVVYEVLELDERHRRIIQSNKNIDLLREFCSKNGMTFLSENCKTLVRRGITTYEQFIKAAYTN